MAEFLFDTKSTANFGIGTPTPEDIDKQRFLAERKRQQEMGWGEATWEFASGLASGLYDYAMEEVPEFLNGKSLTMGMLGLGDKEGDFEDAWGTIGRSAELGARDTYNTFKVLVGNVKDYFNSELSEEERGERAWYRHQYEMNYFNDAREKFIDASTSQYGNKLSFLADFTDATNLIPSVGALKFLPKATRSALKGSAELSGKALSRTGAGLMGVSDIAGYPRSLAKKYKLGEVYGAGQALGVAGAVGGATGVAGTISTGMTGLLATNIVAKMAGKLAMEVGEVAKIFAMPSSHARFLHRLATSDAVSKQTRKTATMLNSMKGTQAYDILFNSFVAGLGAGAMQIGIEGAKGKGAYEVGVATGQGIGMGSGVGLGISATGAGERGAGKTLNSRNPDGTLSDRSLQGMENYLAKKKQANNIEQIKAFGALDDTSKIAVSTLDELAGLGNFRMELVDDQEATRIILESENSDSKIEIPEGTKLGAIPSAFYDPKSRSVFIHDKQVKEGSKIGARLFLHEFGHHAFREMLGSSPMSRRQILANYEQEDGYEFEYFDDGGKLMGSVKVNEEAFNFAKDYANKIRSTSPVQAEKLGFDENGNWKGRGDAKLLSEELGAEQWSMAYQYEPNAFEKMNKGIRHTLIDAMKTGLAKLGVVEPDSGNPAKSMISEAMTASPEVKKVLDNYVQKRKQHLADRANDIDTGRKHTPDKSNGQTSDEKYTSLFGGIGINKAMGRHFHIQDEQMFNELLETLNFEEENAGDFTGIGKGNEGRQLHWKTREMFGRAGKYNSAVKEVIDFIQEAINNREMLQFGYRSANWFKASDYNPFFERSITPYAWQISPKKPRFSLRHGRTIYPNLKVMGWDADVVENNIEIMNSAGLLGGRKVEDFKKDFAEHAQSVLTESGKEGRINPLGLGENELFTMAFGMRDSGVKIQNPELNEWFSSEANTMKQALKSYDVSALAGMSGEGKSGYAYDYKNVKHNYMPSIAQNGFENSTIPPRAKRYSLSQTGSTFVTLPEEYNKYTDEELDLLIRDPDSDYYRDEENLRLNESLMDFALNPVESQLGKIDRLGTFLVGATRQNPEIFAHKKQTLSMDMPDLEMDDRAEYTEALIEELESMLRNNLAKYDDLEIGFQDTSPQYYTDSISFNITFSDQRLRDRKDFKELTLEIDTKDKIIGFDTSRLGNLAGDDGGNSTNSYFSGKAIYQALYDFADGAGLQVVHTSLTKVNQLRTISTRLSQLLKSETDAHITETGKGSANLRSDKQFNNGLGRDDVQVIAGVEGYEGGTIDAVAQELYENDPSRFEFLKMMEGIDSATDVLDNVPFEEGYGRIKFANDDVPSDGFIRKVTAYARQELRLVRYRMQHSDWKDIGFKKEDVVLKNRDESIFEEGWFNQLDAFRYDFDSGKFIFTEYRKDRGNSLGLDYVIGGDGVQHPWFASDKRNPNTDGFRSFFRNHKELIFQGVGESTLKRAIIANTIARATDAKVSLKPFSDRPKFVQKTLGKKLFFMPEGYQHIDIYSYGETQLLQGDSEFANKIASRYKNEPIHVGRHEVINSINQEQAPIEEFEERGVANKPYGLWFARGDGWMQFIDRNHFGIIGKQAHKLNLNTSEIAQVNKNTITDFENKYLVSKDFFNDLSPIYGNGVIDWKKVAEDYSGVEVNLESFGESRPKWLTGWDITSGALWNDKALNATSHLKRVNGELNFMPEVEHNDGQVGNAFVAGVKGGLDADSNIIVEADLEWQEKGYQSKFFKDWHKGEIIGEEIDLAGNVSPIEFVHYHSKEMSDRGAFRLDDPNDDSQTKRYGSLRGFFTQRKSGYGVSSAIDRGTEVSTFVLKGKLWDSSKQDHRNLIKDWWNQLPKYAKLYANERGFTLKKALRLFYENEHYSRVGGKFEVGMANYSRIDFVKNMPNTIPPLNGIKKFLANYLGENWRDKNPEMDLNKVFFDTGVIADGDPTEYGKYLDGDAMVEIATKGNNPNDLHWILLEHSMDMGEMGYNMNIVDYSFNTWANENYGFDAFRLGAEYGGQTFAVINPNEQAKVVTEDSAIKRKNFTFSSTSQVNYMPYVALTDETAQQFDRVIADMKANPYGFTIDQSNELHAKSGYVVAPEKETEFVIPLKEMTRTELWSYIRDHAHRFKKEGAHLGGWVKDDTQFMLDVAFPVENYLDAVRMAIWGDQDSIYDINTGTEIETKNEDKSEQILPPHFPISIEKIKQARPENLLAFADARNRDKGRVRHESFTADSRTNLTDEEVANLPIMDSLQFMPSVPTETFSKETAMGFPMLSYENTQKKIELPNRVIPKTESLTKNSANWDERKWNAYFEDNRVADGLMRQMANNATPEAYALITQIRLNRVGSFDIPAPPTKLLDYVNNPQLLIDWLDRTMANNPEQINLAKQGVASAKQMYNVKKTPEMVSQAFIWGLLSRMLDPYNQEAGWLRLTNNKQMWQAIFDSIDGKYSMDKGTFWDAQKIGDERYGWKKMQTYKKAKNKDAFIKKKMSKLSKERKAGFAKEANDRNLNRQKGTFVDIVANMFEDQKNEVVAGNNAKQNIQAIHDMLVKWNGRWAELTDLFNDKSLDGQGIREKMWATGFLGAGVKDKVTSFVIALMADPNVVIMDRWQFVNVWEHQIQDSVRNRQKKVNSILAPKSGATKAEIKLAKEQAKEFNKWGVSPYRYDESGTPEDRSGFYKTIGSTLDNPVEHALYRTLEFYFGELAQKVSKMNPQYAWIDSAFSMHWVTWNMIKQEAVGHSSFDVLTEMAQNGQFPMSASARQIFVDDFIKKPKYTEKNERLPKENKTKRTRFFQDAKGQPIEEIREREKERAGLGYRIKGEESVYFKGLPPEQRDGDT